MHNTGRQGLSILSMAACAAAAATALVTVQVTAQAALPTQPAETPVRAAAPQQSLQLAARDMAERYYRAYRLIGSHVLNLDGQRIGQVANVVLDDRGDVRQVLVALTDTHDSDGGSIAVSPHRTEVVSTTGAFVTVIRVDLSREELIQAQLVRLKSDARAPAQRGAAPPDPHREYGPLY